jgi:hypothetical protein
VSKATDLWRGVLARTFRPLDVFLSNSPIDASCFETYGGTTKVTFPESDQLKMMKRAPVAQGGDDSYDWHALCVTAYKVLSC